MRRSALLLAPAVLAVLLASGIAWAATIRCSDESRCTGTPDPDTIYGSTDEQGYGDSIYGRESGDRIYGREGDDRSQEYGGGLHGNRGDDGVRGGEGQDDLFGERGADRLFGGPGPDELDAEGFGGASEDASPDLLAGGPGDDFFYAISEVRDTTRDRVYCGSGFDTVSANDGGKDEERGTAYGPKDYVDDSCEDVTRR